MSKLFVFGLPFAGSNNMSRVLSSIPNINVRHKLQNVNENMNLSDVKYLVSSSIISGYRHSGYRIPIDHLCKCKISACNRLYVRYICDLVKSGNAKAIVVHRDNLEQFVSWLLFKKTKIRNVTSYPENYENIRMQIKFRQFVNYCKSKKLMMREFDEMIGFKDRLDIHYDDLKQGYKDGFKEVFQFLGVPGCEVKPHYVDTSNGIQNIVENYQDIIEMIEDNADLH